MMIFEKTKNIFNSFSSYAERNQFGFITLIIVFIGSFWRVWQLDAFKGFSLTEGSQLDISSSILNSHWLIPSNEIYRAAYVYIQSMILWLSHNNIVFVRSLNVLVSILLLAVFFFFVKNWFNKQVALLATLFMSMGAPMIIYSRVISDSTLIMLSQISILLILTYAFRDKSKKLFALAGLLSAVCIFISPLFVISGLLLAITAFAVMMKNRKFIDNYKIEIGLLLLPISISFIIYLFLLPNYFSSVVEFINPGTVADFYKNLGINVVAIFNSSPYITPNNVGVEPLVDPFVALTSICGIVYALFHSGKRKHQFLLMWLLVGISLVSLSAKQSLDYVIIILPVLYIFSAMLLDYLLTNWTRTFPFNKTARIVMTISFSLFIFLSVYYNYQKYFYGWLGSNTIKVQFVSPMPKLK